MSAAMGISEGANKYMSKTLMLRRMLRNKFFVIGFVVTAFILLVTIFSPLIVRFDPTANSLPERLMAPDGLGRGGHIFGTDALGRDVFTRLLIGGRSSLSIAFTIVFLQMAIGAVLGIVAGYAGGVWDTVIMRICDIFLALPNIILAVAIIAVLGTSTVNLIVVLTLSGWVPYCKVIRNNVRVLTRQEFVYASKTAGGSHFWIMRNDLLPNITTPLIVLASQKIGLTILIEASLSFLNLGIQPPTPSWGNMIADGRQYLATCPWLVFAPGIALMFTALAFNFLGDGLRDVLDPKSL